METFYTNTLYDRSTMSVTTFSVLLLAIGLGCSPASKPPKDLTSVAASASRQDGPMAKRAKEFVQALNDPDPKVLEKFADESADPEVAKAVPLDRRVEVLRGIKEALGKLELKGLMVPSDEVLVINVTTEKQGNRQIKLTLGGPPKFGIRGIQVGAAGSFSSGPSYFEKFASLSDLAKIAHEESKAPAIAIVRAGPFGDPEVAILGKRRAGTIEPITENDLWLVGSIGKSMTSTMIGVLVDQGKLKWTTTVGEALSDIPMKEAFKSVTLAHLLQHRGGIPQDMGVRPGGPVTPEDMLNFANGAKTGSELRERYARNIINRDPVGPVGTFRYSNAGYALAVVIAERASGRQFSELMAELLFKPLGMTSAKIAAPGEPGMPGGPGQNSGHQMREGQVVPHTLAFKPLSQAFAGAGGGIAMTVGDLAKYGQFHLNGLLGKARLMSQANFDVLHRPAEGLGEPYGCGWSVSPTSQGGTLHHHNGSDGTFQADLAVFPKRILVVACIVNMGIESDQPTPEKVVVSLIRASKTP